MSAKDKEKKVVAVIGYGSQGRAIARNLHDSNFHVRVGLRAESDNRQLAASDSLSPVYTIGEAVRESDVIIFALPDHHHADVLDEEIAPNLKQKGMLMFLHALSVHFSLVTLPSECDVVLVAPHAPGSAVRENFLSGDGISAFLAIRQDYSGNASEIASRVASGFGVKPNRLLRTTFRDEAIGDIFGEQAVLCGGLAMLVKTGFEVLLEKGHNPDHAFLEVVYQLDLLAKLIRKNGITGMFDRISLAARFGSVEAGPKLIDGSVKERMLALYDEIESGVFADKFSQLDSEKINKLSETLKSLSHPKLDEAARKFSD